MKTVFTSFLILFCSVAFAQQEIILADTAKQILNNNPSLQTALYQYLDYSSCMSQKPENYLKLYSILSKEYLNKQFPNIKTAQEYKTHMIDRSEIYHLIYLSIDRINFVKKSEVEIKFTFESGNEGVLDKMEEIIYFKLENQNWMYNGFNPQSLKVIETIK